MVQTACVVDVTSFDLSKALTFSRFFNKVKLSPSARLVLRCLVDFWNPTKGLVYPGQNTVAECTGVSIRSVINAIEELRKAGIILTTGNNGERLKYYFTAKFFELVKVAGGYAKTAHPTGAKTAHHEQKKIEHKNKKIIHNEPVKEIDSNKMNEILKILQSWKVFGAEKLLKENGIEKLEKAIEIVIKKKPYCEGSYLRRILESDFETSENDKKPKYHHNTQITGISVPKYEPPKPVKCASPLDFTREEALEWLETLPPFLHKSYFANEVKKKWII